MSAVMNSTAFPAESAGEVAVENLLKVILEVTGTLAIEHRAGKCYHLSDTTAHERPVSTPNLRHPVYVFTVFSGRNGMKGCQMAPRQLNRNFLTRARPSGQMRADARKSFHCSRWALERYAQVVSMAQKTHTSTQCVSGLAD